MKKEFSTTEYTEKGRKNVWPWLLNFFRVFRGGKMFYDFLCFSSVSSVVKKRFGFAHQ